MGKPQPKYGPSYDLEDSFAGLLDGAAKLAFWAGLGAILLSVGFLVFTYITFSGGATEASVEAAQGNISLLQNILIAGVIAIIVGSSYMYWGDDKLGALLLIGSIALYTAPFTVPQMAGGQNTPTAGAALGAIQVGGMIAGICSILVILADVAVRVRIRAQQGARSDLLKYGKGVKEERDIRNVFMGKCWQLPFCRKFVRERCPIYHSKRTCWKERVGCMCEEEVIRNAMENRAIPKDMVAAAKYIPYNNKLTLEQKQERCRQCVIYNEHQKHKYKFMLPVVVLVFAAVYVVGRGPMLGITGSIVDKLNSIITGFSYTQRNEAIQPPPYFQEVLLVCLMVVLLAYTLKLLEYVIFKLKA